MQNMHSTRLALQKLESELDFVIENDMFVNGKSAGEITEMRETKKIDVLIEGGTIEKISLETFEIKFEAENGGRRILFPSTLLNQQVKPDLKGSMLLEGLTKSSRDIVNQIVRERLLRGETKIEEELEKLENQSQSVDATVANLVAHFDNIVDSPNPDAGKKRDIGEAIIGGGNKTGKKIKLSTILASTISGSVESELLVRNGKAAASWEIVNNRRGKIGENMVSMAVNLLMDQFLGMTVVGLKSHSDLLAELLNGLNLEMGGENSADSQTGKKEQGLIFTWLEEDALVINMVRTTMLEEKPWRLENQEKKQQAAAEEIQGCLNQLLRDLKTFKELFPDITDIDMKNIR